jgi:hypothetical protein|tara:strand:- start:2223 stop:2420 length:198 start_codon:yes stop_codon:yes gene_type:complete
MKKTFSWKDIDIMNREQKLIYFKNSLKSYKKRDSAFVNFLNSDVYKKHIAWYKKTINELEKQNDR